MVNEGLSELGPILLHHVPQSRSQRVLWLLHELGIPFDVRVWPFDKTLRGPEFLALNPAGRVPALEMDGRSLWETGAIIEVLCERTGRLGRAADHRERADWLIWVHFSETISQHAAALTQQHVALREEWMRSPTIMKLEAARVGKCFDALEARLKGDWLLTEFSAADVAVGQAVLMARRFHMVGERPRMAAWMSRLEARPAYRAACDEGQGLYAQDFYEVPHV
ncbi:glutathione S-transferase [Jannaschia pagri]|uniref:Glutathione S-transferase n=1 Tax=Jannaschia pagri TaxID=2829797 RepID=A0ABQ4NRM9_9RHOB|nr:MULTISPECIES: glutathione S-transferase family protein [unclassified Jannaschia]GIT92897.1 glutathione S-transferase [Jannaschia sp. AI_61]GIT96732.1 glutathione S-transferase [Jannaschia sp. AI_62]